MSKGYNDPYKYKVDIGTDLVYFGFDGKRELALFGGSFFVTYPQVITLKDVEEDIKENYQRYKDEDLQFTYQAWGYYD